MNVCLNDSINPESFIEISILTHDPDPDEGSRFMAKFYINNQLSQELEFGWTNRTLKSFINLLRNFPVEEYNGYFSHFEKHLELQWKLESDKDLYFLTFDLLVNEDDTFSLKATQDTIKAFGHSLESLIIQK